MSTTTANVIADNNQNFSLNGEWLIQCLVYKATSTTSNNSFVYYGTSVGEFKTRYNNHTKSFRHRECMKETELSKPVWKLKTIVLITICHRKYTKRSHHANVFQNVAIFVWSFMLIQTLYLTKELNWFPDVATEINFCWPTIVVVW